MQLHYSTDFFFLHSHSRRKPNQQKTSSKRNQGLLGRGKAGVKERPRTEINIGGSETETLILCFHKDVSG